MLNTDNGNQRVVVLVASRRLVAVVPSQQYRHAEKETIMQLDSVRNLKASVQASVVAPLAVAGAGRPIFAAPARTSATARSV